MATTPILEVMYDNKLYISMCKVSNNSTGNITECTNDSGQDFSGLTKLKDPWEAAIAGCQIVLCLFISVGNTLTMVAISTTPALKTIQNKYIFSLGAADQLVGVALLEILVKNLSEDDINWTSCQFVTAKLHSCITCSLFNMLSIAVDRYVFIVHPFAHMRHVTSRRTDLIILSQWVVAFAYGFGTVYGLLDGYDRDCGPLYALQVHAIVYVESVFFFGVSIGIGITYGMIARVAKEHQERRMKKIQQMALSSVNASQGKKVKDYQNTHCSTFDHLGGLDNQNNRNPLKTEDEGNILYVPDNPGEQNSQNIELKLTNILTSSAEDKNVKYIKDAIVSIRQENSLEEQEGPSIIFDTGDVTPSQTDHKVIKECCSVVINGISFVSSPNVELYSEGATTDLSSQERNAESCLKHTSIQDSIVKENARNIVKDNTQHFDVNPAATTEFSAPKSPPPQQQKRIRSQQDKNRTEQVNILSLASLRWMKQMVIVFGLFLLCWTPCLVSMLLSVTVANVNHRAVYAFSMLGYSNSAVNFFVYSFYNKQFRQAIMRKIRCKCKE